MPGVRRQPYQLSVPQSYPPLSFCVHPVLAHGKCLSQHVPTGHVYPSPSVRFSQYLPSTISLAIPFGNVPNDLWVYLQISVSCALGRPFSSTRMRNFFQEIAPTVLYKRSVDFLRGISCTFTYGKKKYNR